MLGDWPTVGQQLSHQQEPVEQFFCDGGHRVEPDRDRPIPLGHRCLESTTMDPPIRGHWHEPLAHPHCQQNLAFCDHEPGFGIALGIVDQEVSVFGVVANGIRRSLEIRSALAAAHFR